MNMQTYGGGLWRTWFDRDLGMSGKVVVQDAKSQKITSKLWDSKDALMNLPSLCIHLDRSDEFKPNKESHLKPILATQAIDQLFGAGIDTFKDSPDTFNIEQKHYKTFLSRIASDIGCSIEEIVDFELCAYDHHPPAMIGLHKEFISSPRLDNLASSLCSLDSIIEYSKTGNKDNSECSMIMLFDHEEIGSCSAQGADSNMLVESTERVLFGCAPAATKEDYYRSIRKSFFISADMAHAVHPNYSEKHQPSHAPKIHEGIVLKINANQRYTTDAVSSSLMKIMAAKSSPPVPIQEFIIKQDGMCGSTIGPMISSKCGMKTVDVGAPQLAMHSIREMCGVIDLLYYKFLFSTFFNNFATLSHDLMNE